MPYYAAEDAGFKPGVGDARFVFGAGAGVGLVAGVVLLCRIGGVGGNKKMLAMVDVRGKVFFKFFLISGYSKEGN